MKYNRTRGINPSLLRRLYHKLLLLLKS